jgi:hypothetical protein
MRRYIATAASVAATTTVVLRRRRGSTMEAAAAPAHMAMTGTSRKPITPTAKSGEFIPATSVAIATAGPTIHPGGPMCGA